MFFSEYSILKASGEFAAFFYAMKYFWGVAGVVAVIGFYPYSHFSQDKKDFLFKVFAKAVTYCNFILMTQYIVWGYIAFISRLRLFNELGGVSESRMNELFLQFKILFVKTLGINISILLLWFFLLWIISAKKAIHNNS